MRPSAQPWEGGSDIPSVSALSDRTLQNSGGKIIYLGYTKLARPKGGGPIMALKWKDRADVDNTVWEIKNKMQERQGDVPISMVGDVKDLLDHSDPSLIKYFWAELAKYGRDAVAYFEERV
jgi:hypothetical protein